MQCRRTVAAAPAARVHECGSKDDQGPRLQLGIARLMRHDHRAAQDLEPRIEDTGTDGRLAGRDQRLAGR